MPGKEHVSPSDIARVTGLDERYIANGEDKKNIDLSTVRTISDGRVVAQTHAGTKLILVEIVGTDGRRLQWTTYAGSIRLLKFPGEDVSGDEMRSRGVVAFYVIIP